MIKLYSDAATKGNPGPTGLGWLIVAAGKQRQQSATLAEADNHHGEFAAATAAFDDLLANYCHDQVVMFYTDSRLLADAIVRATPSITNPNWLNCLSGSTPFQPWSPSGCPRVKITAPIP